MVPNIPAQLFKLVLDREESDLNTFSQATRSKNSFLKDSTEQFVTNGSLKIVSPAKKKFKSVPLGGYDCVATTFQYGSMWT
jgi:hypothetical protein